MFNLIKEKDLDTLLNKMQEEEKLSIIYGENPRMILLRLPKGFKGEDELHEDEDDLYFILGGSADLLIKDEMISISKGDFVHIPAKTKHKLSYTKTGVNYLVVKIKNEN